MTDWPIAMRNIIKEEKVTQRRLEAASGVSRSSIKRALKGQTPLRIDQLEDVLASLGYSLILQKTGEVLPELKRPPRKPRKRQRGREPILSRLIKAAGMEERY